MILKLSEFPSPTGVTYYKYMYTNTQYIEMLDNGFRPLQGLPIINPYLQKPDKHYLK